MQFEFKLCWSKLPNFTRQVSFIFKRIYTYRFMRFILNPKEDTATTRISYCQYVFSYFRKVGPFSLKVQFVMFTCMIEK